MANSVILNGVTYTDDDNATTGMANNGHRVRLIPMFSNAIIDLGAKKDSAAASAAAAAASATALSATSTTSLTPSLAEQIVTTQSGKDFPAGTFVMLVSSSDSAVWMYGPVTSYSGTTLTFTPSVVGTATAKADWNISGRVGARGAAGLTFTGGSLTSAINTARATVASAATTADIWGAAGNQIDWTGTVTCTGFPAAPQAGAERVLICVGAAPFTAGANMLIDGVASGSTVTCAANDQMIVRAVSTTQFKLSRVKYDGTAQVTPIASALILLSTVTASAAATVDVETTFNSTYDDYLIVGTDVVPSLDALFRCQFKISGAYLTAGYGRHTHTSSSAATGYTSAVDTNAAQAAHIQMTSTITGGRAFTFWMYINNPAGTVRDKYVRWNGVHTNVNDVAIATGVGTRFSSAGALTGIRFLLDTGTITGTFRLYGIANS